MIACNVRNLSGAQQPQLCTDVADAFQYGVVMDRAWDWKVYKFNAATKAVVATSVALSTLAGNPLSLPSNPIDDHFTPFCFVDGDDYIWVGGNSHTEPLRMIRSTNPADVSAWTTMYAGANYPFGISGANSAEYNVWNRLSDGTTLWFFSQPESSTNSRGRDFLAFFLPPGFGTTWLKLLGPILHVAAASDGVNVAAIPGGVLNFQENTALAGCVGSGQIRVKTTTGTARIAYTARAGTTLTGCTLVSGSGLIHTDYIAGCGPDMQNAGMGGAGEFAFTSADLPQGVTADRVYITGVVVQPPIVGLGIPERIHVTGIWRTLDEDATSQQQPFYLYCDAADIGKPNAWKNADGTSHTMPIGWANRSTATITTAPNYSISGGAGIGMDELGQPYFVLENMSTPSLSDPGRGTYVIPWWSRALNAWQVFAIPQPYVGASNGPKLVGFMHDLFLITQSAARRIRLRSFFGTIGGTSWVMGPPVGDGTNCTPPGVTENAEPNVDPIAWQRGRLEMLLPDGDTPTITVLDSHQAQRKTIAAPAKTRQLQRAVASGSGSSADLDNVVSTNTGGMAYFALYAITATDITVQIEHSTDGVTWVGLAGGLFTLAAAPTQEALFIASGVTINRHLRATRTVTGAGNVDFLVSFART